MWIAKVYISGGDPRNNHSVQFVGERWECAIYIYSYRQLSRTYSLLKERV